MLLLSSLSLFLTLFLSRALSLSHSSSHHHAAGAATVSFDPSSSLFFPTMHQSLSSSCWNENQRGKVSMSHRLSLQENLNENPNFVQPSYRLNEEEETRSWKKLINIAVSGAAGMISNHLLFKIAKYKEALGFEG
ncbi:hypothetical protein RIF29_03994 [Crotalaria pallida]|uniref:Uncharacterized protein n=1 Tax=Crotalaria pallida TaxID=3830 RepID=A0AAN9PA58_CROPI